MTDTAVVGVYYDSLGGDYNEKLQPHAWYYKTMLGLTEGATITWRKGSTSMQLDGWTCGYRSMCVVLKILHLAEEGAYNAEYPPFIECSTTDVESMRTEKAPAMFAMTQGCLAYLPSGIFWKPEWKMDPDWDDTISTFPTIYPTEWFSPHHIKLLQNPTSNNIRVYDRASRRPQGGRKDSNRVYLVVVKEEFTDKTTCEADSWIEDIIYIQCRNARHDDAMMTVDDFCNHGTPWMTYKKRTKATMSDVNFDNFTPQEKKVFYLLNHPGCSSCCRCKRTASTQVSGRAKRKAQEMKEAEIKAQVSAAPSMAAGPSALVVPQGATLPDDAQELHPLVKKYAAKLPMFAPIVVGLRDSTTGTVKTDAPGDEVSRALVLGSDAMVKDNRQLFDLDLRTHFKFLVEFAQGLDKDFWEEVGFKTSEHQYRVSYTFRLLHQTASDSIRLPQTMSLLIRFCLIHSDAV